MYVPDFAEILENHRKCYANDFGWNTSVLSALSYVIALAKDNNVPTKWISAREKIPDESGGYIVNIQDPFFRNDENQGEFNVDTGYITVCGYDKDSGLWRECPDSYYCANLENVNTKRTYFVSHWMPLPLKPEDTPDAKD